MRIPLLIRSLAILILASAAGPLSQEARAADEQLDRGRSAIQSMAGCYLVDYSYVETASLKPEYGRDPRVYDVNRDKSVKEWISAGALSPRRIRLQRILFATDLGGAVRAGSAIRHRTGLPGSGSVGPAREGRRPGAHSRDHRGVSLPLGPRRGALNPVRHHPEDNTMTPLRIVDVFTCPKSGSPMVLLEDEARARWLGVCLPMNEANRLARTIGKTRCSSVPVFDLLQRLAETKHLCVLRAELDGDEQGVRAALVYRDRGSQLVFPCHPGDALAMAVRAGAPIVASESAMAHATPVDATLREETVRAWLQGLRPSDFAGTERA